MSSSATRIVFGDAPDDLERLLAELQALVVQYPIATQAAFRALVAEGRAFARTPRGQELAQSIADSPLVRRGRMAWDVVTARAFDDDPDVTIPTVFLDALAKTAAVDALEPLLSRLFEAAADTGSGAGVDDAGPRDADAGMPAGAGGR
ncbi:hypothetical protein K2Z84_27950 [Candidatus Binatia bacterium]|nr:hypothetical protein [Candidatus Binatia bacterium]